MKRMLSWLSAALLCSLATAPLMAEEEAGGKSFQQYKNIVDAAFVAQYAKIPIMDGVMIVDSRPSRKYDKGHIVPSTHISNTQFDKYDPPPARG